MKVKCAKALAARVKKNAAGKVVRQKITDENNMSFDPLDEMADAVVDLAINGEFDFLDPLTSVKPMAPDFDQIFSHQMMIEFGTENGPFLLDRFKTGRVSPKLKRQIEQIRDYTAGVFRRQYLSNNRTVLDTVAELYRRSYLQGGLEKVDQAIARVNERLKACGSRFGFGPGTACMEGDNGTTEWIAVIFSDLEREEFLSLEWCHLQYHPAL